MAVRTTPELEAITRDAARRLAAAGVPSPEVDARWLVEHVVERFGDGLSFCNVAVLDGLVDRRIRREPLQRIIGSTSFRWLDVDVRPGVFVPRPETEVVAGEAIAAARFTDHTPVVVDCCTGSGVIALSVADEVPGARVWATDASDAAVRAAVDNASSAGLDVTFLEGDLVAPLPDELRGAVDVLVANPPYLPAADVASWEPEVRDHDPHDALVGGPDGHEVVARILGLATDWLRPGGVVIVEIDDRRGPDAMAVAEAAGLVDVRLLPDLTGRDRAVVARRALTS